MAMPDELKARLKVDDDTLAILEGQGLDSEEALNGILVSELTGAGVKLGPARIIAREFALPVEPTPLPAVVAATPPPAVNVTVTNNDPATMRVSDLLTAVANGDRDPDILQALGKKVGQRRRVYVRDESGRLDVNATMELINEDIQMGEEPPFWGNQPTEYLTEILEVQRFNDPLTSEPITKGNPWLTLSIDQMAAVAYARLKGFLRGTEDPYTIVAEASATPTPPRWERVQALWRRAERSSDPLALEARAAIYRRTNHGHTTPREEVSAPAGRGFRSRPDDERL